MQKSNDLINKKGFFFAKFRCRRFWKKKTVIQIQFLNEIQLHFEECTIAAAAVEAQEAVLFFYFCCVVET